MIILNYPRNKNNEDQGYAIENFLGEGATNISIGGDDKKKCWP